jgi:tRNA threonylcarbamoyladenosine biosynthesis protein TsaB
MTLGMAVETTSTNYGVAVFDGAAVLAATTTSRADPRFESVAALAAAVLADAGRGFTELDLLAVDTGPGNLTSVRAGVAYVNGLAFSVDAEVVSVDGLTLAAHEIAAEPGEPVLVLRHAGGGAVCAGLFGDGGPRFRRGPFAETVRELVGALPEVTVGGIFRDKVQDVLPAAVVKDSGLDSPSVLALHALVTGPAGTGLHRAPFATPTTEASPLFHG